MLNTDYSNDPANDKDMISNKKAAAYYDPWKKSISRMQKSDKVFLYRSGTGIIARGIVKGNLKKANYHGKPTEKGEEYYVELDKFSKMKKPLPASEIKNLTGIDYRFMKTCFSIDKESGNKIWSELTNRI